MISVTMRRRPVEARVVPTHGHFAHRDLDTHCSDSHAGIRMITRYDTSYEQDTACMLYQRHEPDATAVVAEDLHSVQD
jgi:hypothetical protein